MLGVCVCVCVRACVRACVRERERERQRQTDRQTETHTESIYVEGRGRGVDNYSDYESTGYLFTLTLAPQDCAIVPPSPRPAVLFLLKRFIDKALSIFLKKRKWYLSFCSESYIYTSQLKRQCHGNITSSTSEFSLWKAVCGYFCSTDTLPGLYFLTFL